MSLKSYDAKADVNKNSALVWAFGGLYDPVPQRGRRAFFGSTLSTAAVHDGLVYIPEEGGYLHCLDAASRRALLGTRFQGKRLGLPHRVDGRVLVATNDMARIFKPNGKTAQVLTTIDMGD